MTPPIEFGVEIESPVKILEAISHDTYFDGRRHLLWLHVAITVIVVNWNNRFVNGEEVAIRRIVTVSTRTRMTLRLRDWFWRVGLTRRMPLVSIGGEGQGRM